VSGQRLYSAVVRSEWSMAFDVRYGQAVASSWTSVLHVGDSNGAGFFPSIWFRPSGRKIHVRYGPSAYGEVNQHPNPPGGAVMLVAVTLRAGTLTLTIDGAVHGTTSVASACSSGCPSDEGQSVEVYFCKPSTQCADMELRSLRFGPL